MPAGGTTARRRGIVDVGAWSAHPPTWFVAFGDDALRDAGGTLAAHGRLAGGLDAEAAAIVRVDELRAAVAQAHTAGVHFLSTRIGSGTGLEDYSEGGLVGTGDCVAKFTSIHPLSRVWPCVPGG